MPQPCCPHCGTRLPAVADAYCPDCREELAATPEEVAIKPTLTEMAEVVGAPLGAVILGFLDVIFAVASLLALFTALATGEWGVALGAVVVLAVSALSVLVKVRGPNERTSVTGRGKTQTGSEQQQ